MPAERFFHVERIDSVLIIAPQVNVSSLAVDGVQQELQAVLKDLETPEVKHVLIDMEKVPFFGSEMLGALHMFWKRAQAAGGKMALCNVSELAREVIRISKFDLIWSLHATRREALEQFSQEDEAKQGQKS